MLIIKVIYDHCREFIQIRKIIKSVLTFYNFHYHPHLNPKQYFDVSVVFLNLLRNCFTWLYLLHFSHIIEFFMSTVLTGLIIVHYNLQKHFLPNHWGFSFSATINNAGMSILYIAVPFLIIPLGHIWRSPHISPLWKPPAPPTGVFYTYCI